MLGSISQIIKDTSTLRRLLFATAYLPPKTPNFWGIVVEYATLGATKKTDITSNQARVLMENLKCLDEQAFFTDQQLQKELMLLLIPPKNKPLGIVLISPKEVCVICGSNLLVRSDKPSSVVLYDDNLGTVPATHYHKYCSLQSCPCTQFYGYYTLSDSYVHYNEDCTQLSYFVSTRETAISLSLLKRLDVEVLIGQISYKQRAEIYNEVHRTKLPSEADRLAAMFVYV